MHAPFGPTPETELGPLALQEMGKLWNRVPYAWRFASTRRWADEFPTFRWNEWRRRI